MPQGGKRVTMLPYQRGFLRTCRLLVCSLAKSHIDA